MIRPTGHPSRGPRLIAAAAGVVCIGAGLYMLSIESASSDPTVFEAMAHGIGIYFIGKGIFVWAMLNRFAD
jgi:hypothetical protein